MLKANRIQQDDKLNKLIDHLALPNQHEDFNDLKTERGEF